MIELAQIAKLRLHRKPFGQLAMAELALRWDYALPRKTDIVIENLEGIPKDRQVFLAMNHTDRYNYWPFQYALHRAGWPYTATWVKGKYYDRPWMARFMDSTNNIPVPSRGYLLVGDFRKEFGRKTSDDEYRFLRNVVDGLGDLEESQLLGQTSEIQRLIGERGGSLAAFRRDFEARFEPLIDQVIRLNREAICELGLNVLVFPQGTRSVRLSRGHTGLVQMASHLGAAIVPIGCNGSDQVYPGNSPFAKGGRIVYRVGQPLECTGPELAPHAVREPFKPLTRHAAEEHGAAFAAATAVVMAHINALLDPPYQFDAAQNSGGAQGAARFL